MYLLLLCYSIKSSNTTFLFCVKPLLPSSLQVKHKNGDLSVNFGCCLQWCFFFFFFLVLYEKNFCDTSILNSKFRKLEMCFLGDLLKITFDLFYDMSRVFRTNRLKPDFIARMKIWLFFSLCFLLTPQINSTLRVMVCDTKTYAFAFTPLRLLDNLVSFM